MDIELIELIIVGLILMDGFFMYFLYSEFKTIITIWRRIIIFKKVKKVGNVVLFSHEAAQTKSFENISYG